MSVANDMSLVNISSALQLSVDVRRDIALALLWSLPREEVVELHTRIGCMLQKDIVGLLPPEIGCQILSLLSIDQILQCGLVSRTWAKLSNEQALWVNLCSNHSPPIRPAITTWADLTLHRQLLHTGVRPTPGTPFEGDEGGCSDTEERGWDVIGSQGGMGGGGGLDPLGMSGGLRRTVWERGGGVLPTHLKGTPPHSIIDQDPPILSHLSIPSSTPSPNYKHLFLVNSILRKRMGAPLPPPVGRHVGRHRSDRPIENDNIKRHKTPIPRVLDDISSSRANDLPGHSEVIYSLELVHRHLKITMPNPQCADCQENDSVESGNSFFAPLSSNRSRRDTPTIVTGREWLLSGSRDRTLRLWQLSNPQPRVVKVYKGGHHGSVLSHFIVDLPMKPRKTSTTTLSPRSPEILSSTSPSRTKTRTMAFSGGSDGTIAVWDLEGDGSPDEVVTAHTSSVLCVKGDDERLVSCSKDQTIKIFDIHTLEEILIIGEVHRQGPRNPVNAVNLSKEYIVSSSGDKSINVYCIKSGNLLAIYQAQSQGFGSIDFDPSPFRSPEYHPSSPDHVFKGTIIGGRADGTIKSFHLVEMPYRTGRGNEGVVGRVGDLTIQDMLALDDGDYEDVEMDDREVEDQVVVDDTSDQVMSEKRTLLLQDGPVYWAECVCQPRKANASLCYECHTRPHKELVRSLKLGERYTISGSYDTHVKIWDRQTGRFLADLSGVHSGRIFAVVADRIRIVSSGLDNRIVVWDFSEGLDTAFVQA